MITLKQIYAWWKEVGELKYEDNVKTDINWKPEEGEIQQSFGGLRDLQDQLEEQALSPLEHATSESYRSSLWLSSIMVK